MLLLVELLRLLVLVLVLVLVLELGSLVMLGLHSEIWGRRPLSPRFGQLLPAIGGVDTSICQRDSRILQFQFWRVGSMFFQEVGLLDSISQLDCVSLQADWAGPSMKLQKQPTRITQNLARLITSP